MRWDEVGPQIDIWTLPAARNKGKRDHETPLAPAVKNLLRGVRQPGDEYVFTVRGDKPYAGQKRLKEILDRHSGVRDWQLHDLRRTVRTGLSEIGIRDEVAERTLNHALTGLDKVYNRHQYLEEKRAALEKWAKHVAFVVGQGRRGANVVPLQA
jgi:integrase